MNVYWHGQNETLYFERPEAVIALDDPDRIEDAFREVNDAIRAGWYVAGFATYELGRYLVPRQPEPEPLRLPLMKLGVYANPIAFPSQQRATYKIGPLLPAVSRSRYRRDVTAILAAIRDGDVYQVNYSAPFAFEFAGDPYSFFQDIIEDGTYPWAAFIEDETHAIASFSPELFIRLSPGQVTTKPMKGTTERVASADLQGAKNSAEHTMIVDLLRNDLHRICSSLDVGPMYEVEHYEHLSTMTSTITGHLHPAVALGDIFKAMFPCGSVTGAPKVAAMQFIAATEKRNRGIFCGSVGYLAPNRTGCWNVAIRTAIIEKAAGRAQLDVGGGIVADSKPEAEWDEIVTKSRFIKVRVPEMSLIETFAREPDGSFPRLELHLERLVRSAEDLHFRVDEARIRSAIAGIIVSGAVAVRIAVSESGAIDLTTRPLEPTPAPVEVCWSEATLDSRDPFLRYKTTWRQVHDDAVEFARRNACFDAILLNERGEVCEGGRTTLFIERDGRLLTPPLDSGLLPGVLRRSLIEAGIANEEVLTRDDVMGAKSVYVGSSARGLLPAIVKQP
jgi:para-aminobenzoate synthetase / 4-amino-4-deoxychorismate lyase